MHMTTSIDKWWRHHCGHQRPDCARRRERCTARLVCDLLSKGHKKLLFNLGDVNYIDSSGFGQSGQCFHERAEAGGRTEAAQPHK